MPAPIPTVQIAFDLNAAGQGNFFTLDDPVKGELDNTSYPLAGDILQDVTQYVRQVSIRRGRSNLLDKFQAGAAVVTLDNRARLFDPTAGTAVSPYGVSLKPRKQVVVQLDSEYAFDGQVEDWDLQYDLSGDSTSIAKAADGFALLGQQTISPFQASEQTTGARVGAILDRGEINWPTAKRNIDTGQATLQGDYVGASGPVNALNYLQTVEADEPGALFVSRDGLLTFRSRTDLQQVTSTIIADDGTGIPFDSISVDYGTESMRNRVSVARLNGGTAVATNPDSQLEYGVISFDRTDSLLSSDAQADDLSDWLVNLYGVPQYRINQVGFVLNFLPSTDVTALINLELGDVIQVKFTPNGIGDPINRFAAIDSIEHNILPERHQMTIGLSQTIGGFILDSTTFGVLDSNILGF